MLLFGRIPKNADRSNNLILLGLALVLWIARVAVLAEIGRYFFSSEPDVIRLLVITSAYIFLQSYAFTYARRFVSEPRPTAGMIYMNPFVFFESIIPLPEGKYGN